MNRTVKALLALTILSSSIAITQPAHAGWDKIREQISDAALGGMVSTQIPSVAACISIDGAAPVYLKAFGNANGTTPATPQTIYRVGSLSKQFTAAAILALIEDGGKVPKDGSLFALNNNVSQFFDGVPHWSTASSPMTVARLATMTSNLPDYTQTTLSGLDPTQPVKEADLFNALLALNPTSTKVQYTYSSTNYFLLAKIIEQVAPTVKVRAQPPISIIPVKQDYRAYIRRRLIERAGLTSTNFIDDLKPLGPVASPSLPPNPSFANMAWPKGAGAMQSNVVDLCKWNTALVRGQVISKASGVTMGTAGSPFVGGSSYGMGWMINQLPDRLEYSHNGFIAGFTAQSVVSYYGGTHYVSVVLLTNGDQVKTLLTTARNLTSGAMAP